MPAHPSPGDPNTIYLSNHDSQLSNNGNMMQLTPDECTQYMRDNKGISMEINSNYIAILIKVFSFPDKFKCLYLLVETAIGVRHNEDEQDEFTE